MLTLAKVNAQHYFYSQNVIQKLYWSIPEICRIDTETTDSLVLCHDVVQGDTVPVVFCFDENSVLEHIGYRFLLVNDSISLNNNIAVRFIERELLSLLLSNDINQMLALYRENDVSVLWDNKPMKQNVLQNKRGLLKLLKTNQGIAINYDGKIYDVTLLFENEQKLSFKFPADAELLTGMNKKERDICLAIQLKNHKAKPDSVALYDFKLPVGDSIYFNDNVIEKDLFLYQTNNINQTLVSYQENDVTVLLNDKPIKNNILRNKRKLLNFLKNNRDIAIIYDGEKYKVSLLIENGQKLLFHFPANEEPSTSMEKNQHDAWLVDQLKDHKEKNCNVVLSDFSYLQLLHDSLYVDKGSSFMIPQINNDVFYTKIDSTYSLVFDSCLLAETLSNALVVPMNINYTINITHHLYGNQVKKYTVCSSDFNDYFCREYDRYFGIKTIEDGILTGTLILSDRNIGSIHLVSVSILLDDLLNEGTMEMQLHSNIPMHNLKTLFGK